MKRVLIVAAEFPPSKSIGRIRIVKFCQHLQELGWEPFVLTVNMPANGFFNPENMKEIPKCVSVYRANVWRPDEMLIRSIKEKLFLNRKQRPLAQGDSDNPSENVGNSSFKSQLVELVRAIKVAYDKFVYRNIRIPDGLNGWILPAFRLGKSICRNNKIDLIFATAPPFSDLIIGKLLKTSTGIPWIADYRDLWTGDVLREWVPWWRRKIEIALERQMLSIADAIIAVSKPKTDVLKKRITKVRPDRFFTLTNGYDPEEYVSYSYKRQRRDKIRFVYTGRLFKNRRGYELVQAVGELFREQPDLKDKLRVEYYGGISSEIKNRMDELLSTYNLQDVFRFFPEVSYDRSKALQVGADILLLIVDTGETTSGVIPGKLFEYIAAQRPIFCIAAPGATSEIIRKGRLGWVVTPGAVQDIRNLLNKLLSDFEDITFEPDYAYLARFEREKLAKRLESVFLEVVDGKFNLK